MVEIVDAPISVVRKIESDQRDQLGNTDIPSKSQGAGEKADTPEKANLIDVIPTIETEFPLSTERWAQLDSPEAAKVTTLFATKTNDLYAMTPIGLYRMTADNKRWHLINNSFPTSENTTPIVEHNDILYIVTDAAVLSSGDRGKTWKPLGPHPKGRAIGLVVRDNAQGSIEFYLGLLQGIFFSDDAGVSWTLLNNGLASRKIYAVTSAENVLFAGTDQGLFRFNLEPSSENGLDRSRMWEQLPVWEHRDPTLHLDTLQTMHKLNLCDKQNYTHYTKTEKC